MTPRNMLKIKKYSNILVFSITLVPLILFFFVTWNRLSLPFVFEWGESAGLNQINRILSGADLYVQPALDFTPLVYTPLYYYLSAGISAIIGNPLFSARAVSLVSAIGSVVLIGRVVQKETKNNLLAWISGMFFLACFALGDGFYDLARVDSLYILFVLIAFDVVLGAKYKTGYLVFGLLVVIGFFIKQSFIIVFLPLHIYLLLKHRENSWTAFTIEIIGLVVPLYIINRYTNGWFFYYIFDLPGEHGYSLISAVNFWISDTIGPLGIGFVFCLVFLLAYKLDFLSSNPDAIVEGKKQVQVGSRDHWLVYLLFLAGAAGTAWITRSSNGGGANNCMVIYSALAIGFGLGVGLVLRNSWVESSPWFYGFIAIVISIQFVGLFYNPFAFLPTKDEIKLNEQMAERISNTDLQVLIPYRSHLSDELGGRPQIHIVNLFELTGYFKGEIQPAGYDLVEKIRNKICFQDYGIVVLDQPVPWIEDQLEIAYEQEELFEYSVFSSSDLLDWQRGLERSYTQRSSYDLNKCLESFSVKN